MENYICIDTTKKQLVTIETLVSLCVSFNVNPSYIDTIDELIKEIDAQGDWRPYYVICDMDGNILWDSRGIR